MVDTDHQARYAKTLMMSAFFRRVVGAAGAGLLVCGLAFPAAAGTSINGSIAFNGVPVFDNTNNIGLATSFTAFNNTKVNPGQQTGDYASIPDNEAASLTPFVFVPPTVAASPLWQLTYGGTTYSFFATSMTAAYDVELSIWNMGGNGYAHIDGFTDTPGTWSLSAGQIGQSFYFGLSSTVVPEPSTSALLLSSLLGVLTWHYRPGRGMARRKSRPGFIAPQE